MPKKQAWETYEDVARQLINDIKSYLGLSMVNPDKKKFPKKDGGRCEIDVSAYNMSDGKLVLVECRKENRRLIQEEVHGFAYRIQQTNAMRGIIVTTIGLQEGGVIAANGAKIQTIKLDPSSTLDNYIAQFIGFLAIKLTDSFGGMSGTDGLLIATQYLVPGAIEQIENVQEKT
jgi:hypothetical protein